MSSPHALFTSEWAPLGPSQPDDFLSSISRESQAAFDRLKHTAFFPENAVIFVERQSAQGIFLLRQGRAKLSACSDEGKTLILRIAEAGELLGLHASITGAPHATTVQTMQPCSLDYVSRKDFWEFLKTHIDAALQVTQILSHECSRAYELTRSIGLSHSVGERLARFLLETTAHGQIKNGKVSAKMPLTHEEVSQLVGTSRETVTRLFSEFKRKDLVELKGATLTILNRPALESMMRATY